MKDISPVVQVVIPGPVLYHLMAELFLYLLVQSSKLLNKVSK